MPNSSKITFPTVLLIFALSTGLANAATVITDVQINTDNINATNYTLDENDIPSLTSSWANTIDASRLVSIDSLNGKIVIYQNNITDGLTIPASNTTAGTFSGAFDFANALTIGGGFGNGGVSISDGSVWIAGSLYIMGNTTNVNVTDLNTNGSLIPTITGTFNLGNSTHLWRNLYVTNITATDYNLEEDDIPSLTSSWPNTLDAERLGGIDQLNYKILIYQQNITDGVTIPQANISDGITIPSANVTAGTFASGNFVFPANLQVNQNLTVSNKVFFVDNDTGRIGIGTRNPTQTLTVIGDLNVTGYSVFGSQNFTNIDASGNLAVGRNLTVSNSVLFVDSNTGRVGIGTTSPTQTLTVIGNLNITGYGIFGSQNFTNIDASGNLVVGRNLTVSNNVLFADNSTGRVGVGTTDPEDILHIYNATGDINAVVESDGTNAETGIEFRNDAVAWRVKVRSDDDFGIHNVNTGQQPFVIDDGALSNSLRIYPSNKIVMQYNNVGINQTNPAGLLHVNVSDLVVKDSKIGIGITSPDAKLDVNGTLYIRPDIADVPQLQIGTGFTNPWGIAIVVTGGTASSLRLDPDSGTVLIGDYEIGHDHELSILSYNDTKVHLDSNGSSFITGGSLGIGTKNPQQKLVVVGDLNVTGYSIFGSQNFTNIDASGNLAVGRNLTVSNDVFFVDNDTGNVGIGTTSPGELLHIYKSSGDSAIQFGLPSKDFTMGLDDTDDDLLKLSRSNTLGNNDLISINGTSGHIGINTTSPSQLLDVRGDVDIRDHLAVGQEASLSSNVGLKLAKSFFTDNDQYGIYSSIRYGTSKTSGDLTAIFGQITGSTGAKHNWTENTIAVRGYVGGNTNGTITNAMAGYFSTMSNPSYNKITNSYAVYIPDVDHRGTVTNHYGIYIGNQTDTDVTNAFALYSKDGTNYFGGNVGIGTTDPQQKLHVVGDLNVTGNITTDRTPGTLIIAASNSMSKQKADYICDGANDEAEIQEAISVAGRGMIALLAGDYIIEDNITIPADITLSFENNANLSINTGNNVTINGPIDAGLYQIFSGNGGVNLGTGSVDVVYPQWWGAKGDGSNNDIQAVQDAVYAAPDGAALVFPPGTYYMSGLGDGIVVDKNFTIKSDGRAVINLASGSYLFYLQGGNHSIVIDGLRVTGYQRNLAKMPNTEKLNDLTIKNCRTTKQSIVLQGTILNELRILDNFIGDGSYTGSTLQVIPSSTGNNYVRKAVIQNNYVLVHNDSTSDLFKLSGAVDNVFLTGNYAEGCEGYGGNGYDLDAGARRARIIGNVADRCWYGFEVKPGSRWDGEETEDVVFANNYAVNCNDVGIGWRIRGVMQGNTMVNNSRSLYVSGASGSRIMSNHITKSGTAIQHYSGDDVLYSGNYINESFPIRIDNGVRVIVESNYIEGNNVSTCIYLYNDADATIRSNFMNIYRESGYTYGIGLYDNASVQAYDNIAPNITSANFVVDNEDSTANVTGFTIFTDGDITPAVHGGKKQDIYVANNTAETVITDFDDGLNGQLIEVHFVTSNTNLTDGTNIMLHNSSDYNPPAGTIMTFRMRGSVWYETSRSNT